MNVVFLGTPDYVLPVFETLRRKNSFTITAIVTQSPKPVGREKVVTPSPVDVWARKNKVPVFYNSANFLKSDIKADIGILAALHERLSKKMINYFPHGILNIHLSLLPKYRSSSCVQAAIINGNKYTGVTVIKLDEQLDHGPIVSQFKEKILPTDTTGSLRKRLFQIQAKTFPAILTNYLAEKIKLCKQNHSQATYANMLKKSDAFIPPSFIANAMKVESRKEYVEWEIKFLKSYMLHATCYMLHNFIRAMQPWPVAWTLLRLNSSGQTKRLKILKAHIEKSRTINHQPLIIKLVLDDVQLEGKKPVSWEQFKKGYPEVEFTQ